ncbi:AAA family ATPase [Paenactinomyces guangxiensis]|uniref:AAA family ATPase n=1 Tax=Paenactinomyces guangxiensis TaxID=1490290 RepID=A0A7W1WTK5_9BACL|nr:AAA family ATPase [Paenactinomyces guangxiensis]MBA4495732.1 AAA family ATPase [Paenactinomyces guangxiensis]MBH8592721.1 AAA family ATPase [Paenactinomyces guangxiensis]
MNIRIPKFSLVVLIGAAGCGKSTFARKHFRATEILSSDFFRSLITDDENDISASGDAFELLYDVAEKRLKRGKLTVSDATNVKREQRKQLLQIAERYDCPSVAIVFNFPEEICQERNQVRTYRTVPVHAISNQMKNLRHSLQTLKDEGFKGVYILSSPTETDQVTVERDEGGTPGTHRT